MNWWQTDVIETLPDEVLTVILKLVADLPSWSRGPSFPVAASRVNRRWRTVCLCSPELWTNVRISLHAYSWRWAPVFVKRSGSCPLDISINLQAYVYKGGVPVLPALIPMGRALVIVGPHVARWRSVAVRGWPEQLDEFGDFLAKAPSISRLESAHLSTLNPIITDYHGITWESNRLPLSRLFESESFRSLRLRSSLDGIGVTPLRAVHTLDVDFGTVSDLGALGLRAIFGPASTLSTLVVRNFCPRVLPMLEAIDAPTIRSFTISIYAPFYTNDYLRGQNGHYGNFYHFPADGFESITHTFSLPNLEYLEILGGFSGSKVEDDNLEVPADWEAPLFPHLHTLRLEGVRFGRRGLALIQSFSREITALQLINTTGNEHLLAMRRGRERPWPALRSLIVEGPKDEVMGADWIASFVAARGALGANMGISELTLSPCTESVLRALDFAPTIRSLPTPALIDGIPDGGFFFDHFDMRAVDFEYVRPASPEWCDSFDWGPVDDILDLDLERVEMEIAGLLSQELPRIKGLRRDLRKAGRRAFKVDRKSKRRNCCRPDVREDFYII